MKRLRLILLFVLPLLSIGCQDDLPNGNKPALLSIHDVKFSSELTWTFLDLPDGVYQPDNPNFHPDRPETWTGNMAKYVKHYYRNTIHYTIKNSGRGTAYDTEVDLFYEYSNGDTEVKTLHLGSIPANSTSAFSASVNSINKQLAGVSGEVFWYD